MQQKYFLIDGKVKNVKIAVEINKDYFDYDVDEFDTISEIIHDVFSAEAADSCDIYEMDDSEKDEYGIDESKGGYIITIDSCKVYAPEDAVIHPNDNASEELNRLISESLENISYSFDASPVSFSYTMQAYTIAESNEKTGDYNESSETVNREFVNNY